MQYWKYVLAWIQIVGLTMLAVVPVNLGIAVGAEYLFEANAISVLKAVLFIGFWTVPPAIFKIWLDEFMAHTHESEQK